MAHAPDEPRATPGEERVRHDLDSGSFLEVYPRFWSGAKAWADEASERIPWVRGEVLRYDHYVPERRRGALVDPRDDRELAELTRRLEHRYRVRFEGVSALWYADGEDFQGLHRDRQMRWLDDTLIAIVVVGEPRPFVLRPVSVGRGVRLPAGEDPRDVTIRPGHGDLVVMGGRCQRDWLHGVPRQIGHRSPRWSLTWRWTSRRGRPDTAPTYFDGRRFSGEHKGPGWRSRRA